MVTLTTGMIEQKETLPNDNVRIYIPVDINHDYLIQRLESVISIFGDLEEANETAFSIEVEDIIDQLEIYDKYWKSQDGNNETGHSAKGLAVAREILSMLEELDGTAECFPYDTINMLKNEWGLN